MNKDLVSAVWLWTDRWPQSHKTTKLQAVVLMNGALWLSPTDEPQSDAFWLKTSISYLCWGWREFVEIPYCNFRLDICKTFLEELFLCVTSSQWKVRGTGKEICGAFCSFCWVGNVQWTAALPAHGDTSMSVTLSLPSSSSGNTKLISRHGPNDRLTPPPTQRGSDKWRYRRGGGGSTVLTRISPWAVKRRNNSRKGKTEERQEGHRQACV